MNVTSAEDNMCEREASATRGLSIKTITKALVWWNWEKARDHGSRCLHHRQWIILIHYEKEKTDNWLTVCFFSVTRQLSGSDNRDGKNPLVYPKYCRPLQTNPISVLVQLYLWIPEHSMHSSTPRLMEAQHGAAWLQSQHSSLPGRLCTLWRRLSPPTLTPLSPLSLGSLAESMLLVEGEAVRSKRCTDTGQTGQRQTLSFQGKFSNEKKWVMWNCLHVFIPQYSNCQRCLCKQRRCSPGRPESRPVAASQTQLVACSSYKIKVQL